MGISGRLLQVQFVSALQTHTVGLKGCVLPAAYVDSDVAALFSFQYTIGFEIL